MDLFTGKKLAELRKLNSLSQENLAEKLNVSRQTISKWERAMVLPDTNNLMLLSHLYDVTLDDILGDKTALEIMTAKNNTDNADNCSVQNEENETNKDLSQKCDTFDESQKTVTRQKTDNIIKETTKSQNKDKGERYRPKTAKMLLRFPFLIIIIIIYLFMGIKQQMWHPSWLIFFTLPIYYQFACSFNAYSKRGFYLSQPVFFVLVLIYLTGGFVYNIWHPSWLIFLVLPLYYWLICAYTKKKKL